MSKILKVIAREILDSRGNPTIESEVHIEKNCFGRASVPSGASVGSKEALELRDLDKNRFFGKGVMKAVNIVNNEINMALINQDSIKQDIVDQIMIDKDGTENKSKFGANAILSVSLANAKAASMYKGVQLYEHIADLNGTSNNFSLPLPMMNIINGGKHANNKLDIQEFMIQPIGATTIKKAIQMGSEISFTLGKILKFKGISNQLGDEGGYAPNIKSNIEVLELIKQSIEESGYVFGTDVVLAIDCASSEFFDVYEKKYFLKSENLYFTSNQFTHYLESLSKKYLIASIEDGQSENDWDGFYYQTKVLGNYVQLVGDDLFVTNTNLLKRGIESNIANSILIKYNQIGTITETLKAIRMAKTAGYTVIVSHRSGETEDTSIADLAVGSSAGQIKTGPVRCSERVCKYNRLIRIEESLEDRKCFYGSNEMFRYMNNFNRS